MRCRVDVNDGNGCYKIWEDNGAVYSGLVSLLISLSSDLCHGGCAHMAGHQWIKKITFCVAEGRSHGVLFLARVLPSDVCPVSPLASLVTLRYPFCSVLVLKCYFICQQPFRRRIRISVVSGSFQSLQAKVLPIDCFSVIISIPAIVIFKVVTIRKVQLVVTGKPWLLKKLETETISMSYSWQLVKHGVYGLLFLR